MTTSQKLWLGFGTLTALLVMFGASLMVRVRSIEANVRIQSDEARPRSAAARELEINVIGYALAVRTFLQTDDSRFRDDAGKSAANIERYRAEYERLAGSDRHRQLATRFADLWQKLKDYGQLLMESNVRPLSRENSVRMSDLRIALEKFLDDEMQSEAVESYNVRRDATFRELNSIVAFALVLLVVAVLIAVTMSTAISRGVVKTERIIAEHAERLRTTLASIGDAVITTDTAGRVTNLNAVAESLTGWTNAAALGRPLDEVFRIVNEDTHKNVENPAVRALREGIIVGLANHTILIAKDGTEHPIDDSAAPIRCAEGDIVGCVLVFRDVGDQRKHARHVAESEARKTAILATALDCIITIDHRGHIVEFNPAAERTFGYSAADVIGREMGELIVPPAMRPAHRAGMARYLATGEGPVLNRRIELTAVRADGTEFPVEVAITPISGEGPPLFTGYLRDISRRKEAEATVAEQLRHAALASEIGLALTGNDTMVQTLQACTESLVRNLDGAFARIWTLNPSEAVLELRASAGLYTHLDGPHARVPVGKFKIGLIAQERKPYLTNDLMSDLRVPEKEWVQREGLVGFAGYPLILHDRLVGVMATFARRPFNESTLAAMASVARGIALGIERKEMENRLRQLVADLSEADRRKDEFLATLAHELRNPLAPIRNGLQLMRLASGNSATVQQARNMMERQLTQLVRLVDDLMDVSRITRGKLELRKDRVTLAAVIASAAETSRPLIEDMGHTLTVELPDRPIEIEADLTRLAQVFLNLLNNAAKYSEPGGRISLVAECSEGNAAEDRPISSSSLFEFSISHNEYVTVTVRDTGIGIAADQLPRIFDMFSQVDRSLEKAQGGLGIGLTLVRRIVEMHGGRVEARSDGPNRGSEFAVRLPVATSTPNPAAHAAPEHEIARSALRVLIVDDNRDGADSLAAMLAVLGNETRTAYDGEAAVAAVEEFRPDAILMDIGMPKLNGYEACRQIRDLAPGKAAFIIAQTGWGQDEDRQRTRDAGFDHHLVKPIDPVALMKLLAARKGK